MEFDAQLAAARAAHAARYASQGGTAAANAASTATAAHQQRSAAAVPRGDSTADDELLARQLHGAWLPPRTCLRGAERLVVLPRSIHQKRFTSPHPRPQRRS